MIDVAHPAYFWCGVSLFFICLAVMFFVVERFRKHQGAVPILFSTHPQELQKLGSFVSMLPTPKRRLVRSITLLGFVSLAVGIWLGVKGL